MSGSDARDTEAAFTRRAILLGFGAGVGFAVLAGRLHHIQVNEADRFAVLSDGNQFNYRLLTPSRGRILDRFGEPLAENEENYTVQIVAENAKDPAMVLDRLSRIVPMSEERKQGLLREISRTPVFRAVTVAENLNWDTFVQVNLHAPELPGVLPLVGETRSYPKGPLFAHVTGYVGQADQEMAGNDPLLRSPNFRVGRDGMEQALDPELRGGAGSLKVEVDAFGRVVRELPDPATAARPGNDVRLTLDAGLQEYAVERLSEERAASAALLDIHNGDILALASYPAYDPNVFARRITQTEYDALLADEANPLFKKAIAGQFPPGSTFKPIVAMAAARHGAMRPGERVFCNGGFQFGNRRYACWSRHGSVDLHDAIKHSCNVYFYEAARRLGIERLAEVAREFGISELPDIGLPGVRAGVMPDDAWKRATMGEPWYPGETISAGIGQGFITSSSLQLATMTARLASGRRVLPRLVLDGGAPQFETLDYAEDAFAVMRRGMRGVCHEPGGTAYNTLRAVLTERGVEMAGKSGSAQARNISAAERATGVIRNENLTWRLRDHALFIAYAPFDAPRYAVAVIVEHGSAGSRVSGPMARDILIAAMDRNSGRSPASPIAAL